MGQPEESARYLNRARSKAPHDPEVLRAVAGQFRDQGKYDEAISTLQSIPTKTSDIQAELAYTFGLAGKQQESAALYSRIAKAAKGNIGLNLSAAQAWVNAGRPEEAQQFLDAAKQIDANHYRLHAILAGIGEHSENRTADAEQEYKTAISNLPLNVAEGPLYPIELRLNLYELYTREGDETNAKDQLSSAFLTIQHVNRNDRREGPELLASLMSRLSRSRIAASCGAASMLRWPSARGPNSSAPSIQPTMRPAQVDRRRRRSAARRRARRPAGRLRARRARAPRRSRPGPRTDDRARRDRGCRKWMRSA